MKEKEKNRKQESIWLFWGAVQTRWCLCRLRFFKHYTIFVYVFSIGNYFIHLIILDSALAIAQAFWTRGPRQCLSDITQRRAIGFLFWTRGPTHWVNEFVFILTSDPSAYFLSKMRTAQNISGVRPLASTRFQSISALWSTSRLRMSRWLSTWSVHRVQREKGSPLAMARFPKVGSYIEKNVLSNYIFFCNLQNTGQNFL